MKAILRNIILIFLLGLLVKCDEDEVTSRNYPRLKTLPVNEITSTSARFNAEIIFRGDFEVINYGFVWSENESPTMESSDRVIYSENIQSAKFSETIETTLKEGVSYFARAFVETNDFIVYGENVSFVSWGSKGPEITSVTPLQGTLGDTIYIEGKNFSYLSQTNKVLFDDVDSKIIMSSDSTIVTLVPDSLLQTNSSISVEIVGNTNTYSESFELLSPMIESISKDLGKTWDTLVIKGQNFGTTISHPKVFFGGSPSTVISFHIDSMKVVVPGGVEASKLQVKVAHQSDEVPFNYLKPAIVDFEPKLVTWGDTVKVTVENFYENAEFQTLLLNGVEYDFLETYEDSVSFIIPNDLLINDGNVTTKSTTIGFYIAGFNLEFNNEVPFKSPQILSLSSDTISFGDLVSLDVVNFHPTNNGIILQGRFRSRLVDLVTNTNNKLEFIFPVIDDLRNDQNSDNIITLDAYVVNAVELRTEGTVVIKSPVIDSFSPLTVSDPGDQITILGENFGDNPVVKFDRTELTIVSSSETEIIAEITDDVFQDPKISEYLENSISVISNQRSGWSTEQLVINHVTKWESVNDGNVFQVTAAPGSSIDRRSAFQTLSGDSYGYVLGGRGSLIECCVIPYGLQKLKDVYRFDPNNGPFSNNGWLRLSDWPQEDDQEELQEVFTFENRVYAITDNNRLLNSGSLPLAIKSSSWNNIADLGSGAGYYNFFEINSQPYVIYSPSVSNSTIDSWISTLDLVTGTQTDLIELPFKYSGPDNLYVYNGKLRYRNWGLESEYEYDPSLNTFNLLGSINHDFKIIEHQGVYYSYNNEGIYTFDPATGSHSQIDTFPSNEFIGFRFAINGKLYYSTSKTTMVSFDTN